ncbi:MAG: diacylglycerol kinase [Sulfurimonadaceae bacterium]
MHNKPKYTLFKNTTYALAGLVDVTKHESSFKLQLLLFVGGIVFAWMLPIEIGYKFVLSISLIIPIMAEITNSAIERVVDLVTKDYHILAKQAKDAGAALVFVSLLTLGAIWLSTLALAFELV